MSKRALTAALAAVTLAAAVAGCGGGGEDPSPTKAQFIKQADAVCSSGRKQVETEFASYLKKNDIKEIGESGESADETKAHELEVIETIAIPALREQTQELKDLGTPKSDGAEAEAFVDATEEEIDEVEDDPLTLFSSSEKVFAKSDKLASSFGFKVCGSR